MTKSVSAAKTSDASGRDNGGNMSKRHSTKGQGRADDSHRLIREGCYLCKGQQTSDDCPYRSELAAASDQNRSKYGGFIGCLRRNIKSGLITSISTLGDKPEESKMQALM